MRNKIIVFTLILVSSFNSLLCTAQTTKSSNEINTTLRKEVDQNLTISVQEDSINELGLIYAVKNLEKASSLIEEGNIQEAQKILLATKEWLITASDYHFKLFQALNKQSKTLEASKIEKAHALDFAQVRDQSFFLLAKVYITQNKLKEAVELLVDTINSQADSELAQKAYETLQEIKFSDKK